MRARPDAGIFLAAPVHQIMSAFRAGSRVVGNLVGRQSMRGADLLGDVVQRARHRLVRRLQFAGGVKPEEWRALLDRELVERQMLGGFRDRALQLLRPHLRGLVGTGVDQVERIAVERAARDRDRIERFARGVQPSQRAQRRIVQRLHAERNPVDAGGAVAGKARRLDAGRIGFQRDLGIVAATRQCLAIASRIAPTVCGCISEGVPPPRKIDDTSPAGGARRDGFDFARKRPRKSRLVDRRVADMAVEIAIRTFRQAERPVHVDAKRFAVSAGQGRSPQASRRRGHDATIRDRAAAGHVFRCWSSRRRCAHVHRA